MSLPGTTFIAGLPFQLVNKDTKLDARNLVCTSSMDSLELSVQTDLSPARKASYYFNEVARQLLYFMGWNSEKTDEFKDNFGGALYLLVRDNNFFDWLRLPLNLPENLPQLVHIGGLPYVVEYGQDEYLDDKRLLGECSYTNLRIRVHEGPLYMRFWVLIHEMTHGILYEANYTGEHNEETLVAPLGTLLFYLLKENDFKGVFEV